MSASTAWGRVTVPPSPARSEGLRRHPRGERGRGAAPRRACGRDPSGDRAPATQAASDAHPSRLSRDAARADCRRARQFGRRGEGELLSRACEHAEAAAGPVMRHLSPDQLIAFVEDPQTRDLTPQERRHVERCAACQIRGDGDARSAHGYPRRTRRRALSLVLGPFCRACRRRDPRRSARAGGRGDRLEVRRAHSRLGRGCRDSAARVDDGLAGDAARTRSCPVLWLPPGTPCTQTISKTTRRGRWCAPPPTDCRGKTCRLRELPPAPAPPKGS